MNDSRRTDSPNRPNLWNRPIRRSTVLKAAAGVVGGGLLAGAGVTALADTSSNPSGPGSRAVETTKVADLTGPDLTSAYRMQATDLGIPVRTPDGRMLFVFGDTFEEAKVGGGWWRSPVALYSETTDLAGGVKWSGAVGGDAAQQLWEYEHDNGEFSTVLPSDVITIGGTMYLQVMVNNGLMNVVWTEIWKSDDNGASWVHTGAKFPSDLHGGLFQLLTWELNPDDNFVYIYSTKFDRKNAMILSRVAAESIADPAAYETWGFADGAWNWGNAPTPVLDGAFGEMCLRRIDNTWLLTWFDAGDYRIDGIKMDSPTANLHDAYRQTLVWGGDWGNEDGSHVAQLYGGYIIPGSTLDDLHLSVSQWNTDAGWPYRVMQHRVRGFGS